MRKDNGPGKVESILKPEVFENYYKAGWALVAYACNPSYSGGSQFEASLGK
jgi:hypothetical protein